MSCSEFVLRMEKKDFRNSNKIKRFQCSKKDKRMGCDQKRLFGEMYVLSRESLSPSLLALVGNNVYAHSLVGQSTELNNRIFKLLNQHR